ncbi:MAG: hypothetical protein ACI9XR_001533 [Flavobacterium sp.]|jgi:hypothetical protein
MYAIFYSRIFIKLNFNTFYKKSGQIKIVLICHFDGVSENKV